VLTFLGIGAQKAGTTWLYEQLRQHPELDFPVGKENHFWDGRERGKHARSIAEYASFFASHVQSHAGEITPAYAILQPESIAEIKRYFPDLRLFFCVRDPVERAWSAARMFLDRAWLQPHDVSSGFIWELCSAPAFTMRGDYAQCLTNWLQCFDASQIHLIDYAQIQSDPNSVLRILFSHLGVAQRPAQKASELFAKVHTGRNWPLDPVVRVRLNAHYATRVERFCSLLNESKLNAAIDTSTWLES